MRKRILSFLLAMVMLVSSASVAVFADSGTSGTSGTNTGATATYTEKIADPSTLGVWNKLMNSYQSTQYLGRIWTDKTVSAGNIVLEYKLSAEGGETVAENTTLDMDENADFQIALSAMSSTASYVTVTQSATPLDIVLVLDTSNSMKNNNGSLDGSPLEDLMDAANAFLAEVAATNADLSDDAQHKVSIITYDGSDSDRDSDGNTVEYSDGATEVIYALSTDVSGMEINEDNVTPAIKGGGGSTGLGKTQTNAGLDAAVAQLQSDAARENAVPVVILFTDGTPNIADRNNFDAGIAADCVNIGYLLKNNATLWSGSATAVTLPTGSNTSHEYTKDDYALRSNKNAYVYTVAVLDGADTGDVPSGTYATAENINYTMHAISSNYPSAMASYTLGNVGSSANTWTLYPGTAADPMEFYYTAANSSGLTDVFTNIADSMTQFSSTAASPTYTDGSFDISATGYVTMLDELGDYMEVKSMDAITIEGVVYEYDGTPTVTYYNANGSTDTADSYVYSETTYSFSQLATLNTVLGARQTGEAVTQALSSVLITERDYADPASRDSVLVQIPASLLPLRYYHVDADGNLTIEESLPIRVVYSVGLLDSVRTAMATGNYSQVNGLPAYAAAHTDAATGEIRFYSNYWDGQDSNGDGYTDGNTYSTFAPATTNPFYYYTEDTVFYKLVEGAYVPVTAENGYEADLEGTVYYQQTYYGYAEDGSTELKVAYVGLDINAAIGRIGSITWDTIESYIGINEDGQYYMIAGNAKLSLANAENFIEKKGENNTTDTSGTVLNPFWNADAVGGNYATYFTENYMGNNGRISFMGLGSLVVVKNVTSEANQTPDANTEFTFEITLHDAAGELLSGEFPAVHTGAEGSEETTVTFTGGVATVELLANESIVINQLPTGTTYTVVETGATLNGNDVSDAYTASYSDNDGTATDGQGTIVTNETDTVSVNNAYGYTNIPINTNIDLSGDKTLEVEDGSAYPGGEHTATFYLQYWTGEAEIGGGWSNVPGATGTVTYSSGDSVTINYTAINEALRAWEFNAPGEYRFRVVEENSGLTLYGVYHDDTVHTFTITVVDDGDGTLSIGSVKSTHTDAIEVHWTSVEENGTVTWSNTDMDFTNRYGTTMLTMEIDKVVNDTTGSGYSDLSGYFFDWVYLGSYDDIVQSGYEVLSYTGNGASGTTAATTADGASRFSVVYDISDELTAPTVTDEGIHAYPSAIEPVYYYEYYKLTENIGSKNGVENSKAVYYIQVAVRVEDGETISASYSVVRYTNSAGVTYTCDSSYTGDGYQWTAEDGATINRTENNALIFVNTYSDSTTAALGVSKNLVGRDWKRGDDFTFTLTPIQYNGMGVAFNLVGTTAVVQSTMPDEPDTLTVTAENGDLVSFGDITFTQVGTYYFKVTENAKLDEHDDPVDNGISYSTDTIYAKVVVTADENHELSAAVYTYLDGHIIAADGVHDLGSFTNTYTADPVSVTFSGTKTLDGPRTLQAGEFAFGLYYGEDLIATATNAANGNYSFPARTYTAEGTYVYTVREINGGLGGISYDDTVYTITVTVTDDGKGSLVTDVDVTGGQTGTSANTLNFTNSYDLSGQLDLTVTKTIAGRYWMPGDSFDFGLYKDVNGEPIEIVTIKAPTDVEYGTSTLAGLFGIELDAAGTYTYYIKELTASTDTMAADPTVYTVNVTATDNGDGTLAISYTYTIYDSNDPADEIAFTNTYEYRENNPGLNLLKVDGETELPIAGASFALYSDAACTTLVASGTTDTEGKLNLALPMDNATYYLKETQPAAGYHPNGTVYTVTAEIGYVAKDGYTEKQLLVTVVGLDKTTENTIKYTYTVENTPIKPVVISVEKVWDDGGYYDRPVEVTATLYRDGEAYNTVTLNAENQWKHTWSGDEYTDEYTWTVDEPTVPEEYGKTVTHDGDAWTITNTRTPKEIEITVTKDWVNNGGVQPGSIEVTLYKDGEVCETVTLSGENNWTYTWTGLTDASLWSVDETDVPVGYESSIVVDGYTFKITNTRIIHPVQVTVSKEWVASDGVVHPASVEVVLYRNGEVYETVTLSAENNWTYTWEGLTDEYTWTVDEPTVPDGYTKEVAFVADTTGDPYTYTYTVTNAKIFQYIDVSVRKVWYSSGWTHPTSVSVTLYRDGQAYDTVTLSRENDWSHTWEDLTDEFVWTVDEPSVPGGYVKSVTGEDNVWIITNSRTTYPIEITVIKEWVNNGGVQPDSIDVTLYRNGKAYDTATLSESNNWTKGWTGLSDAADWSVEETNVPAGYSSTVTENGYVFKITNTRTVHPVKVTVNKVWAVSDGTEHPAAVEAVLYRDGEAFATVTLSEENGWTHTWEGLTDEHSWTVDEPSVPGGYAKEVIREADETGETYTYTYTITNSETLSFVDVSVNKVWHTSGKAHPDSVSVTLYRDGQAYGQAVLDESNGWSYVWEDLDDRYTWTVDEPSVPGGYNKKVSHSGNSWTITNTYEDIPATGDTFQPVKMILMAVIGVVGFCTSALLLFVPEKKGKHQR